MFHIFDCTDSGEKHEPLQKSTEKASHFSEWNIVNMHSYANKLKGKKQYSQPSKLSF